MISVSLNYYLFDCHYLDHYESNSEIQTWIQPASVWPLLYVL